MMSSVPRARPLTPRERRHAIVDTTQALVRRTGAVPSTREIADAAGIAEGTLYRAFETKERLLEAVAAATFCPAPVVRDLRRIDERLPLRPRLVALVTILQRRFLDVFDMMRALGLSHPPHGTGEHAGCSPQAGHVPREDQDGTVAHTWSQGLHDLVAFVEHDADQLACTPEELARYVRVMTFAGSNAHLTDGQVLPPETIVGIVLDGVLRREPAADADRAGGIPRSDLNDRNDPHDLRYLEDTWKAL